MDKSKHLDTYGGGLYIPVSTINNYNQDYNIVNHDVHTTAELQSMYRAAIRRDDIPEDVMDYIELFLEDGVAQCIRNLEEDSTNA